MDEFDKLKNLPPEIIERLKAGRAEVQAKDAEANRVVANLFDLKDSILVEGRTPSGLLDPNAEIFAIGKFQNSKGDTVYLRREKQKDWPSLDQIVASSARVKSEEARFRALDPSAQARVRQGGSPQFGAYLSNEALREKFQKLK